jgi:hypothetical protein
LERSEVIVLFDDRGNIKLFFDRISGFYPSDSELAEGRMKDTQSG